MAAPIPRRRAGLAELPLSYGQEQLWFLDRFAPGLPTYNIVPALRLSGPLDDAALDRVLTGLVARHEALRTRLVTVAGGHPVQVIDPPGPVAAERVDLSELAPGPRGGSRCASWPTPRRRGRSTWPPGRCCGPGWSGWLRRLLPADPSTCC